MTTLGKKLRTTLINGILYERINTPYNRNLDLLNILNKTGIVWTEISAKQFWLFLSEILLCAELKVDTIIVDLYSMRQLGEHFDSWLEGNADQLAKPFLRNLFIDNLIPNIILKCNYTNRFCEKIAPYLHFSSKIHSLEFKDVGIKQNINIIINSMMENKSCTHLSFTHCAFDDNVISCLLKLLKKNGIVSLDISENNLSDEGLFKLFNGLIEIDTYLYVKDITMKLEYLNCTSDYKSSVISTQKTYDKYKALLSELKINVNMTEEFSHKRKLENAKDDNDIIESVIKKPKISSPFSNQAVLFQLPQSNFQIQEPAKPDENENNPNLHI